MKQLVGVIAALFLLGCSCFAQTSADDSPATKADVERYLQITGSHDMMKKTMATMSQSMHQMTHDQYVKHQSELPAGYESKMNALMDDMFQNMPMDEIMESMVPAYQKHLTVGDINNLITFYSSPTGAKLVREMPEMLAEAMQDMMPILTRYMDTIQTRLQKETETMIAQSKKPANNATTATHN
jgi:hypothetical protein